MNIFAPQHLRIFWALLRRDLMLMKHKVGSAILNTSIFILLQIFIFGHLFPTLGMPKQVALATCVGQLVFIIQVINFLLAEKISVDLASSRVMEYHLTLPLPKKWLFGHYIISFVLETLFTTLPILLLGSILLGSLLVNAQPNLLLFTGIYVSTLFFFSTLLLALAIGSTFRWFTERMWSCILAPLLLVSSTYFQWSKVAALSPKLGILFLANPLTYISEGFRGAIIGGPDYLDTPLCIAVVTLSSVLLLWLLSSSIHKRLDPV